MNLEKEEISDNECLYIYFCIIMYIVNLHDCAH